MADDIICICTGCVYYRSANGVESKSNIMCHFALDNGYPRGIPPVDCYKKEGTGYISKKDKDKKTKMIEMKKRESLDMEVKRTRKQYDQATKDAAVKAVLIDGERVVDVAERFGINVQMLHKWKAAYKEKQAEFIEYAEGIETELNKNTAEDTCEKTDESAGVIEPVKPEDKSTNENVCAAVEEIMVPDNSKIKSAAYDEISSVVLRYSQTNESGLLFYINGIIGLTERLCGGSDNG